MGKKKRDKKKREQCDDSSGWWNAEDLDFDRHGRLVLKNPVLARRIVEAISRDGGLVVHITPEMSTKAISGLPNFRCPIPLLGCPNPNKTDCPDMLCGDRFLRSVSKPALDNPPDPAPESDGGQRAREVPQ